MNESNADFLKNTHNSPLRGDITVFLLEMVV